LSFFFLYICGCIRILRLNAIATVKSEDQLNEGQRTLCAKMNAQHFASTGVEQIALLRGEPVLAVDSATSSSAESDTAAELKSAVSSKTALRKQKKWTYQLGFRERTVRKAFILPEFRGLANASADGKDDESDTELLPSAARTSLRRLSTGSTEIQSPEFGGLQSAASRAKRREPNVALTETASSGTAKAKEAAEAISLKYGYGAEKTQELVDTMTKIADISPTTTLVNLVRDAYLPKRNRIYSGANPQAHVRSASRGMNSLVQRMMTEVTKAEGGIVKWVNEHTHWSPEIRLLFFEMREKTGVSEWDQHFEEAMRNDRSEQHIVSMWRIKDPESYAKLQTSGSGCIVGLKYTEPAFDFGATNEQLGIDSDIVDSFGQTAANSTSQISKAIAGMEEVIAVERDTELGAGIALGTGIEQNNAEVQRVLALDTSSAVGGQTTGDEIETGFGPLKTNTVMKSSLPARRKYIHRKAKGNLKVPSKSTRSKSKASTKQSKSKASTKRSKKPKKTKAPKTDKKRKRHEMEEEESSSSSSSATESSTGERVPVLKKRRRRN